MPKYDPKSRESIIAFAEKLIGTSFADFLPSELQMKKDGNKGNLGQLLEKYYFEKDLDNASEPDFPEAGIELKATPIKRIKNGEIRSKERLVLNMINYLDIVDEDWNSSVFKKKNASILLTIYLYEQEKLSIDYIIQIVELFCFQDNQEDFNIIKNDWLIIQNKIKQGKAHELSESDTMYLSAATKGSTAEKSLREQPFSEIKAKQRAFSFKSGYMNYILKRISGEKPRYQRLFDNTLQQGFSFEDELTKLFEGYMRKTAFEIGEEFNLTYTGQKNYFSMLSNKIMGVNDVTKIEEFTKANITLKTIRQSPNGNIREDISFPAFDFCELVRQVWEDTDLYNTLESQKFFFVIFKMTTKSLSDFDKLDDEQKSKHLVLERVILWNAPGVDIEQKAKPTFEKTVQILKKGVVMTPKKLKNREIFLNNLPVASQTEMIHVRPHARNRDDTNTLPDGREFTKQSFWLNNNYIKKQLDI